MKKKYLLAALAVLVIVLGIGSTAAYFNATDTAENVFTVGDVEIELTEEGWDPEADHLIAPNAAFDKAPIVTNTGKNDAYVRVHVKISNAAALVNAVATAPGEYFYPEDIFTEHIDSIWRLAGESEEGSDGSITYTYNYHEPIAPGESTDPVFTKITFPATLDVSILDTELQGEIEITITADAIQAEGFSSVGEAFGAFDLE